jgi:hypothetical protein
MYFGSNNSGWSIHRQNTSSGYAGGRFQIRYYNGISGDYPHFHSAGSNITQQNTWYHICLTHNNTDGTSKFYIDGKKSAETDSLIFRPAQYSNTLTIGTSSTTYGFEGMVHDFRYYDYAIAANEVNTIYHNATKLGTEVLHPHTQERNYKVELYIATAASSHATAPYFVEFLTENGWTKPFHLFTSCVEGELISKTFPLDGTPTKIRLRADKHTHFLTKSNLDGILYWKLAVNGQSIVETTDTNGTFGDNDFCIGNGSGQREIQEFDIPILNYGTFANPTITNTNVTTTTVKHKVT